MKKKISSATRSLTKETEEMLNRQIVMEGKSAAQYLSMASWSEMKGYETSGEFLYNQSEEERMHMLKLFRYINMAGGHAKQPEITGIQHNFKTLKEVFDVILKHEISVTKSIHKIVDHCLKIKDFTTFEFLQWYVKEQYEEEVTARRAVELFQLIGQEGVGLFMIDQEIGKLRVYANKVMHSGSEPIK